MFEYKTIGLPNIRLVNGYSEFTYDGEKAVSIEDVDGLHRLIAHELVENDARLTGAEFRFLRVELDLSQSVLAELLGVTEQAVAKWEKDQNKKGIPKMADNIMRALVRERLLNENGRISQLIEHVARNDRHKREMEDFHIDLSFNEHWSAVAREA